MRRIGTGEMAQYIRVSAAKIDIVSSVPGTHIMEGEHQLQQLTSNFPNS